MAYVVWRVLMKKYSRVRLGLHKGTQASVTPSTRQCASYDGESWKSQDDEIKEAEPEVSNRESKSKRVKNYWKKCRSALGNKTDQSIEAPSSSWYVEKQVNQGEVNEVEEVFETAVHFSKLTETANIIEIKKPCSNYSEYSDKSQTLLPVISPDRTSQDEYHEEDLISEPASSLLLQQQERIEEIRAPNEGSQAGSKEDFTDTEVKHDVASLVEQYFRPLYANYSRTSKTLVRQARDLLVCEYHGCLQRFENEFCVPASKLLQHVKDETAEDPCSPQGWPLCLGDTGIVINLGPICPTLIRHLDSYLCIKRRATEGIELALLYRYVDKIHLKTLAEFVGEVKMCTALSTAMDLDSIDSLDSELPDLLQNLLVSIEHAVERVPLDDLTFPCPQCLQYLPIDRNDEVECAACSCHCSCSKLQENVVKRDTSIQTSPMFEFVGSIPHIDSDEDEDKESIKSGVSSKKSQELVRPTRITDLPEKLLMSGINLPGSTDVDGRPIILCYAECIARAGLNKYEIAKLLLYYASIPSAVQLEKGLTILLLAETDEDNKVLEYLDKSIVLIGNHVKIFRMIIWRPGINPKHKTLTSRIQAVVVSDEGTLSHYISKDQTPASCGGSCVQHDQLEWVEFFRQLEPFLAKCRSGGRALLSALSQLRHEELPYQVTRRFLNHQCRQISKAIQLETLQKLRNEGPGIISSLEERAQWLSGSSDVKRATNNAKKSFATVTKVATRLEQLANERKERIKELQRLKVIQKEAEELLNWMKNEGEESLNNQFLLLRAVGNVSSIKELEKNFENFHFDAMRQIDKTTDLIEESNGIKEVQGQNLKEQTNALKSAAKFFSERVEELREKLEDCSRCYQLYESCHDILEDDGKEQEDFKRLAVKSENKKLIEICKVIKSPLVDRKVIDATETAFSELIPTSTPNKPNGQIRRRSVSSYAYIYKCNHHAAGVPCNCYESDTENSVSYKLKRKYMQTLQNCGCGEKDSLERKSSVTLDGIKEVRESVENLLENTDDSRCGRCDSGVSTAENSLGDDSGYKKKLERSSSGQFYREGCTLCSTTSSSTGSNQDHTENQQDSITEEGSDGCIKSTSSDDIDDHFTEERRKVLPVASNSHLYYHSSIMDLPSFDVNTADSKTQKTLLYIMHEMIQTERDYVRSLDFIIENYIPELMREDIPQALRGHRNVVFGNVEKIYEFHNQHFLRELSKCENHPLQVGQIFLKYSKQFYLYALYNKNKPKSDSLMSEYGGNFFKAKQLQLGDKMDLASYLLKPVQRMGKYALLLQQLMKACPELPAGTPEYLQVEQDNLKQAEQMVRFQLRHGNDLLAMDSIRECDVNLKEQGRLLRQNEFLVWEGRNAKKSLRQVFLFEELILFSKAKRFPDRKNLDLYYYKNSMKMTDIGLTAKIGDSPTKFEIWFRKRKPNDTYTLQSMSEDIKKAWTEELSQLLWKQAIRNREVRMQEMSSMGIGNKPCLDIRPSKDQINDRSISFDQLCKTAPKFRNSFVGPANTDTYRNARRPHSVISMSSVSSGSTSSGASSHTTTAANNLLNLGFDTSCDSPKTYHRSGTLNSQCSMESGIISDMSSSHDEYPESTSQGNMHWPLVKSSSQHSEASQKSSNTNNLDDYVADDISVHI